MVWEEWMNVAICVGDIEMLDKAPSGFAEPSHPCGQYVAAPLTLIHINSTQSSRSGQADLFLFQFVQRETKMARDSSVDRADARLHTSMYSNS